MMKLPILAKASFILPAFLLPLTMGAKTAVWALSPEYKAITPMENDRFFKVKKGYRFGIADNSGKMVVPATVDSITDFTDGYALALAWADDHYRLTQIIAENGKTTTIADEYFVGDYPFFSEGKLPVYNKKGRYGYIDTAGRLVIDFKYTNIHPFCEGLAAVSKGKSVFGALIKSAAPSVIGKDKVFYIDDSGRELKLQSDIGDIYFGSSFSNGEALVANKKERYFTIAPSGRMLGILSDVAMEFDDKFRWKESGSDTPAKKGSKRPADSSSITVFTADNLYGYRDGASNIVVPAQFTEAMPVNGGYAVVRNLDGDYGMIQIIDGDFLCRKTAGSMKVSDSSQEAVDYTVTVPEFYKDIPLKVVVVDKAGQVNEPGGSSESKDGMMIRSAFRIPKGEHKVEIIGTDNLIVFSKDSNEPTPAASDNGSTASKGNEGIKLAVAPLSAKANLKDIVEVKVTVYNNTAEACTLPVSVAGKEASASVSSIKVPANGKKTFTVALKGVIAKEKRKITFNVGNRSIAREIEVKPVFE